jgi:hypothetical protein
MVGIGLILPPVPICLTPPPIGGLSSAVLVLNPLVVWTWAVMALATVGGMVWLVVSIGINLAGHPKDRHPRWRPTPVPQQA